MLKIDLPGNGTLGDSTMACKIVQNNTEKRNFLERMKEREKRQKKKVKISPRVKLAQAEFRKKTSFKGRSPIDNLKTSPAVKNFVKEKFDKEKVMYSFLPERQVQLQMIQRYKIEIENGKKELPIKEKGRPLKAPMSKASKINLSPGRKSTRVIDCPPYFAQKLVKSVRFQSDCYPDDFKPKMKTSKPPFKSILKVANKGEDKPVKLRNLQIKIIPDSHSPRIKNLDQYLNDLENRNNKVHFDKEFDTASRKMMADNAKPVKLTDTPVRRVPAARTKLLFTSPKYDDIQSTPDSDGAPVNVEKLLAESRDDSNELPVNVDKPLAQSGNDSHESPVNIVERSYPLVNSGLEPSNTDEETRIKSIIVKVAIVLDSHTSPIKALEVYRDHLERGDQETRFEKLINTINQGKVDNDFNDDLVNQRKVDEGINDELTGNVFKGKHQYTILTLKKSESKSESKSDQTKSADTLDNNSSKRQSFTINPSEIQHDKAWYSETEETFLNRFSSIIEPPTEICSIKEDIESKQINSKYGVEDSIFYDKHESSTDVEHDPSVLPFKKQHENSSSDINSEGFFSEDVDMENYTNCSGVSTGINFRKNDGDTSNSLLQTPQQVFDDEEIMYHQNEVGVPTEKTVTNRTILSPELMSSPQCLKAPIPLNIDTNISNNTSGEISGYNTGGFPCDLFSEVEEADSAMELTENGEEKKNDENCKIS